MPTTKHNVTATAWVEVGQGPLYVECRQHSNARIHFGDAAPEIDADDYHNLPGLGGFSYAGTEKCFARSEYENGSVIVTGGV